MSEHRQDCASQFGNPCDCDYPLRAAADKLQEAVALMDAAPCEHCAKLEARLRAAERLASALRPFANLWQYPTDPTTWDDRPVNQLLALTHGNFREARVALHGWDTEENTR